jgi:hypothetical protein
MGLAMMTEHFQAVVDRVAQLPEQTQERIALEIEQALQRLAHLDGAMKLQPSRRDEVFPHTTAPLLKTGGKA